MAPEVIEQESSGYDWKVDIWSLGITAIELATGKAPYAKYPAMKVMMMTVQNESPRLEQCCHEVNVAFSAFKKCKLDSFIAECLQKDPFKRPTASKLLKHEMFKKFQHPSNAIELVAQAVVVGSTHSGKESKFIDFVEKLPHFKHRAQKVKRVPGSTGSMHRTQDGGWEWSDDELEAASPEEQSSGNGDMGLANKSEQERRRRLRESSMDAAHNQSSVEFEVGNDMTPDYLGTSRETLVGQNTTKVMSPGMGNISAAVATFEPEVKTVQPRKFELCLRMRNDAKELNDIKFPFNSAEDSADSVAQEMVTAGLIDGNNKILLAHNIVKIIEGHVKQVMFKLNLPPESREIANPETFCGYAKLSLVE